MLTHQLCLWKLVLLLNLERFESSEQLKKFMSDLPSLDDVGQVLMDVGQSLADAEGKKVDLVEVK